MLDQRYLQVVTRPRVTGELLGAYGVSTVRWETLQLDVPEATIQQALRELRLHRRQTSTAEELRTLDLVSLRQGLAQDTQMIRRTVLSLEPLRLDWRRYGVATSVCLGLGALICTTGRAALAPLGWGLVGVAIGILLALDVIRLRGPRVWSHKRHWHRRQR